MTKLYFENDLDTITNEKMEIVMKKFSGISNAGEIKLSILDLFSERANEFQSKIALDYEGKCYTYKEIDELSNSIAYQLIEKGVTLGDVIGVFSERSANLIIFELAILKANATYLPLDIAYPLERIQYMIEDSSVKLILKDNSTIAPTLKYKDIVYEPEAFINENINEDMITSKVGKRNSNSSMYIIYTSGTTGKPKGVEIADRGIIRLVNNNKLYNVTADDVTMASASISFDASVLEIWSALLNGSTLLVLPPILPSLEHVTKLMNTKKVSSPFITTSLFHQLIQYFPESFNTVSRVWTGGEVISRSLVSKLLDMYPNIRIFNCYGPTENSVVTTIQEINKDNIGKFKYSIPIGRTIQGTTTYVLDENMKPVEIGSKGELYTGGIGLAKGYIKHPSLTAKAFINNPFSEDEKGLLYKTGDIVRYTEEGDIEYIGRKDNQVKIMGYRIELGEIEMRLSQCSNVASCIVEAVSVIGDEKSVVAYIVPKEKNKAAEHIYREELNDLLPSFMIPTYFIILDSFNYTQSGKIDKKSLPKPKINNENLLEDSSLTPRELYLKNLWETVLKCNGINRDSNFFNIGGHSLYGSIIIGKIRKEMKIDINVQDIFENPILKDFVKKLDECERIVDYNFKNDSRDEKKLIGLSSAQERLYFLENRGFPTLGVYNIPAAIKIQGVVDENILKKSIEYLIDKHELLKAAIKSYDGEPKISILSEYEIPFKTLDFTKLPIEEAEKLSENEISDMSKYRFDMDSGKLFLTKLIKLKENYSVFLIVIHHIICDGWGLQLILKDISEYYNTSKKGIELQAVKDNITFRDYVKYEKYIKEKLNSSGSIEFWKNELSDHQKYIKLSLSAKHPKEKSYKGGWVERNLNTKLSEKIKEFAKEQNVTVYSFLLAVYNILLAKYSDEEDICVGTPFLNREEDGFKDIVGFFVNTVSIRNQVSRESNFIEFLQKVHEKTIKVFKYSDVPFDEVVKVSGVERTNAYNPIFQYVFSHQDFSSLNLYLDNLNCKFMSNKFMNLESSKFDMSLFSKFEDGKLNLQLEFSTDLFNEDIASEFIDRFVYIIKNISSNPLKRISEISLINDDEELEIIDKFSNTETSYPRWLSLAQLFKCVAKANSKKEAIIFEDEICNYEELDKYSDCMAIQLKERGVKKGNRVAICMKRSSIQIISILAILKCGASYVPIDLNYPDERIEYMIRDTDVISAIVDAEFLLKAREFSIDILLADIKELKALSEKNKGEILTLDNQSGEDEAYVLYTSGSTGKPKGIMVPNRAVARLVLNTNYIPYKDESTFLQMASLSFDAATFEIWAPLLNGYKLVLYPGRIPEFEKLQDILNKNKVTHCWLTAGLFNSIVDEDASILRDVPYIYTGGEKISEAHVRKILSINPEQEIINGYGPTENTTFTTTFSSKEWSDAQEAFPIGYPISNTKCYILDEGKNQVPVGIVGDLYAAGDGIALGYLNNEKLTKEVFVENKFEPGSIMYKTGDKARFRSNGVIEYMGRADDQIKLRGFRIELTEIEKALLKVEKIENCLAIVTDDPNLEKNIVAYYTSISHEDVDEEMIKLELNKYLPKYMMPAAYVRLDKFELNINGKVDKKKLPRVQWGKNKIQNEKKLPITPTEKSICDICENLLNINGIGMEDEFFELGGHSLLVGKLVSRINKKFKVKIRIADIFKDPTLYGICDKVNQLLLEDNGELNLFSEVEVNEDSGELSFSQQRIWLFDQINPNQSVFNIPISIELEGTLDIDILEKTINKLNLRHRSLRTNLKVKSDRTIQEVQRYKYKKLKIINGITKEEALVIADKESRTAFNLSEDSLIRHKLIRITDKHHILLITMHHIISDGWSFEVYLKELSELYTASIRNEKCELEEIKYDYISFTEWQKRKLNIEQSKNNIEELKKMLKDLPDSTIIPSDYKRAERDNFIADRELSILDKEITNKLKQVAMNHGVSMYMILLANFHALIYRLINQDKIVTGSPITNREGDEINNVIGFFVNNLVNITEMNDEMTFSELLSQVRRNSLQMYRLSYIPFEVILDLVRKERRLDQTPIFQMMFNWIDNQTEELKLENCEGKVNWDALPGSKFDLTLYAKEVKEGIKFDIVYDKKLFKKKRMKLFLMDFQGLISEFIESQDIKIIEPTLKSSEIEALPDLNEQLNCSDISYTVIDKFQENRNKNPEKIIIQYGPEKLSFEDIGKRIEAYIKILKNAGFKKNDIIPIIAEKNPELVISILSILKMGCCFSIIDAQLPLERIKILLNVTKNRSIINISREDVTNIIEALSSEVENLVVIDLYEGVIESKYSKAEALDKEESLNNCEPEDPMYICFTSGSTGVPKAVVSPNKSVLQSLEWFIEEFKVKDQDKFINLAGLSHDPLIRELLIPICANAKLIIPTADEFSRPAKLRRLMYDNGITILAHITPSLADIFSSTLDKNENKINSIRLICFTGERLMRNDVVNLLKLMPNSKVENFYGATEVPQTRSFIEITKEILNESEGMPAGKGIKDTQLLIMNKANQLCGVGEIGEVTIRTPYVSYGYLNDKETTSKKFTRESKNGNIYIYRTGDYGRYLPSGNIQLEGRKDRQVKIRGYRVELDEVEEKLNSMPQIEKGVVKMQKLRSLGDNIVAFFVSSVGEKVDSKEVKKYLSKCLPSYMVPAGIKAIDNIPLTANGKVNYSALVFDSTLEENIERILPRTEVEKLLCEIYSGVINVSALGVNENFFNIGGNSLIAFRIIAEINRTLYIDLGLKDIFLYPTIEELAKLIEKIFLEEDY